LSSRTAWSWQPVAKFADTAVVVQQEFRRSFGSLNALNIPKEIFGRSQACAKANARHEAIASEIENTAARKCALSTRQENSEHRKQESLGFSSALSLGEHYRLVVKVTQDRGAVDPLESVKSHRVTIVLKVTAEDKRASLAQDGPRQGDVCFDFILGILAPDPCDCLGPQFFAGVERQLLEVRLGTPLRRAAESMP